MSEEKDASTPN